MANNVEIKFFKLRAEEKKCFCDNCQSETFHEVELYFANEGKNWSLKLKAQCWRCRTVLSKEFKEA